MEYTLYSSDTNTVNAGECLLLQGNRIPEFYRVVSGRLAKVKSKSNAGIGLQTMLSNAELLEIVSDEQLIGEKEALMNCPIPFSVFALDQSCVETYPAQNISSMQDLFVQKPVVAVKACISFARFLNSFFSFFSRVCVEETNVDSYIRNSARDYLAAVNELETISTARNTLVIREAKAHPAYSLSQETIKKKPVLSKSSSISCGRIATNSRLHLQKFPSGFLLCKKNTIGDTLFIITSGTVEVVIDGVNQNICIDKPGSIIGEIAVFMNLDRKTAEVKRTADVICVTEVEAIVIGLEQVESFFSANPEIMTKLLLEMVSRSEQTHRIFSRTVASIRFMLFKRLGILLDGLNKIAHNIQKTDNGNTFVRPRNFCAQRARDIYNRFKESVELLKKCETLLN